MLPLFPESSIHQCDSLSLKQLFVNTTLFILLLAKHVLEGYCESINNIELLNEIRPHVKALVGQYPWPGKHNHKWILAR